ncbi:unnamed protein product, partial [Nesidiocoris tenuis]
MCYWDTRKGSKPISFSGYYNSFRDVPSKVIWIASKTGNECMSASPDGQISKLPLSVIACHDDGLLTAVGDDEGTATIVETSHHYQRIGKMEKQLMLNFRLQREKRYVNMGYGKPVSSLSAGSAPTEVSSHESGQLVRLDIYSSWSKGALTQGNDDVVRVWITVMIVYIVVELIIAVVRIIMLIFGQLGADVSINIISLKSAHHCRLPLRTDIPIGGALQAILYLMDLLRILPRVGKEYTTG